jgi:hypothetical protein
VVVHGSFSEFRPLEGLIHVCCTYRSSSSGSQIVCLSQREAVSVWVCVSAS